MDRPEIFFEGFLDDYFVECEDHVAAAGRALLALDAAVGTPGAEAPHVDELFRIFHSVKGISAMVELRQAEQLAHHLEHYLRAVRDREVELSANGVDVLIEGTQRLEQVIGAHRAHLPLPSIDAVVAAVSALAPARSGAHPANGAAAPAPAMVASAADDDAVRWRASFSPTRDLLARGVGVDTIRKRLAQIGTIVHAIPDVRPDGAVVFTFDVTTGKDSEAFDALRADGVVVKRVDQAVPAETEALSAGPTAVEPPESQPASSSHVVRVDLARLDDLMQGIGDLVISRARLSESLARVERHVPAGEWRAVQENAVTIDRQLRSLRERIMRVRLVPIGEIFRRMPFVVRDLARESGKRVALDLQGQTTEIDKFLIERMLDPVLHLVRNAVSHGIETPEERAAAGKRPEGTITLSATAAGEIVTIEISDDGRGVDAAAVAARARAAGLPVPPGTPDAAALVALLCATGFSTKDEADRASGRGVGMAVVKSTVEQLSGSITMATEPGVGTRFTIELPVTLAITDALIGRVGAESFAVPQGSVREVIEVSADDVRLVEQNEITPYRGGALPIVRLARLFGVAAQQRSRFHVFVIGKGASAVGLAVDRVVGQREIVVRAIADPLVRVEGIAGATDLGDGRVVLILDPASLARLTRDRGVRTLGDVTAWGRVPA